MSSRLIRWGKKDGEGSQRQKLMGSRTPAFAESLLSDELPKLRASQWGCLHIVRQESLVKEEVVKHWH